MKFHQGLHRVVPLSAPLIELLRRYYHDYRPREWLFEGVLAGQKYGKRSIEEVLKKAVIVVKIKKPVTLQWLKHSYTTHLHESGVRGHIMKIKFAIILFLGTLPGIQSLGQYIRFSGIVQTSSEPIAFAILTLKNMAANTQFEKVTDFNGHFQFDSLVKGHYQVTASFKGFEDYFHNDLVLFKDSLNNRITLEICDPKYPITKCPVCNLSDQVIRVGNDGIMENREPWGDKQQEYKIPRKVRKYGYETYYFNGQELLYYIVGEKSIRLYSENTLCDCLLFCKKDKIIFKSYTP